MAAPQAPQSRASVGAASLFAVLAVAKAIALTGHHWPSSPWAPFVFFWQDAALALAFGAIDLMIRPRAPVRALYSLIAVYVAVNVPVVLVLSSPLTWPMLHAAGGPLWDSIARYAGVVNLGSAAAILLLAVVVPWVFARFRVAAGPRTAATAVVWIAIGIAATPRVNTLGLERNALGALFPAHLPGVSAAVGSPDWRVSPYPSADRDDLKRLGGAAKGRNVLMIVLESTAARYLKMYGAAADPTPTLTRLASQAVVFDAAYAVYPESIKGLFATLCSRYPAYDTEPGTYAGAPCASLAASLKSAGYHTALFHSGRFAYLGMRAIIDGRGFDVLEDAGAIGGHVRSSFGVDEPSTVARLLGWVDSLPRQEPFFAAYLPVAGHHPYATPVAGPFDPTSEASQYLNALHDGDAAIGALLEGLRRRHLDDRTLLVIFGDHGEAFGQHDGNVGHTQFLYDENVRVPYLVALPGRPDAIARVGRVASLVDTAPTVLDLLGLPAEALHQGHSLLKPVPRLALFYTDYSLGWLGLRDGCWKYLFEIDARRSSLFDVCADPDETIDRSGADADRVRAYRDRVAAWSAAEKAYSLRTDTIGSMRAARLAGR